MLRQGFKGIKQEKIEHEHNKEEEKVRIRKKMK